MARYPFKSEDVLPAKRQGYFTLVITMPCGRKTLAENSCARRLVTEANALYEKEFKKFRVGKPAIEERPGPFMGIHRVK